MSDLSYLDWPFFEQRHRQLAARLAEFAPGLEVDPADVDGTCRSLVAKLGEAEFLHLAAPEGGIFDLRSLCIVREALARHDGLADFAFAMQGLGTGAITLFGTDTQKVEWLPAVRRGEALSAFALTEPQSGSDVAAGEMTATRNGDGYVLEGEKTWISNGGIADVYTVFARTGEGPGAKGLSAFVVPADSSGLSVAERLEVMAPHPLARLRFDAVRVPETAMLGAPGQGFKVAMSVLDVFRTTVAAAALGFARRALDEAMARVSAREVQGQRLSQMQMVQGHLAEMGVQVDAAALLVYRAGWVRDTGATTRITREAAMAKLFSTEAAQDVIDRAVQLHGGDGVRRGQAVEALYRDIRALRIYEGASDVQKIIIARSMLSELRKMSDEAITDFSDRMSYGDYLSLDTVLSAQHPVSDAPDEMLFIIQHQTSELWMKLMLQELGAARDAIAAGQMPQAFKMLARVCRIMEQLNSAWDVLRTMTPSDYTTFRDALGASSGFQSAQYRLVEFVLGNRKLSMMTPHAHDPDATARLEAELARPTLYQVVLQLAAKEGHRVPEAVLAKPADQPHDPVPEVQAIWAAVYRDTTAHWTLYEVGEKLVDLEDYFRRWRFNHVTTVERVIGMKRGTGGTGGVGYLKRMLEVELFPELWRVRTEL